MSPRNVEPGTVCRSAVASGPACMEAWRGWGVGVARTCSPWSRTPLDTRHADVWDALCAKVQAAFDGFRLCASPLIGQCWSALCSTRCYCALSALCLLQVCHQLMSLPFILFSYICKYEAVVGLRVDLRVGGDKRAKSATWSFPA